MKTKPIFKRATGLGRTIGDNLDWKFQYEKELKQEKEKREKMNNYDREIYMSEYVTIPKARLRRLIITEVIAWGISVFLLLISVLR
jgi:hypothetical protein